MSSNVLTARVEYSGELIYKRQNCHKWVADGKRKIQIGFLNLFIGQIDVMSRVCVLVWHLWNAQNSLIWHNKRSGPKAIVASSTRYLEEWQHAQSKTRNSGPTISADRPIVCWSGPNARAVKCNFDAVIQYDQGTMSYGSVIGGERGQFVKCL
ncbi:hypothetical protein K2173_027564 [Erythroxylum novogranatense]|uniref:Uncharacterized protein n=1 Tax=Erythroxylum novogranatense TaxID=1862640 RepID=A0AAV8TZC0_9ROSI|nr:hypothetical protein K2173_027564 [Erythroxylum novogranatense]